LYFENTALIYMSETATNTYKPGPMPTVPSAKENHYTKGMTKRGKKGAETYSDPHLWYLIRTLKDSV
jgi:hypothetical protein